RVVVEERRAAAAPRQAPLFETEHEDGVEAPRAGAPQVDDRHTTRVLARPPREHSALDSDKRVLAAQLSAELTPALELGEQSRERLVRPEIEPTRGVGRWMVEPVRVAQHSSRELTNRLHRIVRGTQVLERGQGPAAQA